MLSCNTETLSDNFRYQCVVHFDLLFITIPNVLTDYRETSLCFISPLSRSRFDFSLLEAVYIEIVCINISGKLLFFSVFVRHLMLNVSMEKNLCYLLAAFTRS